MEFVKCKLDQTLNIEHHWKQCLTENHFNTIDEVHSWLYANYSHCIILSHPGVLDEAGQQDHGAESAGGGAVRVHQR